MNGYIDDNGRALLNVELRSTPASESQFVEAWIDTGFTGELVLPTRIIESSGFECSGSVDAILADGSQIQLRTYTCFVDWFDGERRLEVVGNEGDYPLLRVGLLLDLELRLNYRAGTLILNPT